ncbi:MAG: DUF72 domain-containing protein [Phycisphaerae bacterium]
MTQQVGKYVVGTSGYSFADWVGNFYPPGTQSREMFDIYVQHFDVVELNFTYYRMPSARTLASLERRSGDGFEFWVKANRRTTHEQDRTAAREFVENLAPLREAGKLAGVLLQFPQSFHRTAENRKYLSAVVDDLQPLPLAVEFRHYSWDRPETIEGLRSRNVALVIPDVPKIRSLFRPEPTATSEMAYLRLHSRNADKWYAGAAERYDYTYSEQELRELLENWSASVEQAEKVYTLFNNCHRGQAAENARAFRRLLSERRGG